MRKDSEKKPECILGVPGKGRAYHRELSSHIRKKESKRSNAKCPKQK